MHEGICFGHVMSKACQYATNDDKVSMGVATLTLCSRPRLGFARVWDKREVWESHFMLPGVQKSVREWTLTLAKSSHFGSWSPSGLLNFQKVIVGVKTQRIEELFISLESYWNEDVLNGLAWFISIFKTQVMAQEKSGVKLVVWFSSTKSRELTQLLCVEVACHILLESSQRRYNFVSDLISIGGLHTKLWGPKVTGVPTLGIYGLQWFIIIYVNRNLAFALLCITSDNQLIHGWKMNVFCEKKFHLNDIKGILNRNNSIEFKFLNWIKIQLKKNEFANWWRKYWKYVCEYDVGRKTF